MTKLLFDSTNVVNKLQPGWVKVPFYSQGFYNADRTRGVKELVQKLALAHESGPMIWDIEHWPIPQYEQQLIEIVDWAREVRPELRQGFYALLPIRNYWAPVLHSIGSKSNEYDLWVQDNARMARSRGSDGQYVSRGLVDAVDFVSPSLYTFYSNADAPAWRHETLWHNYAQITIDEARKYQKPVYPWIWPRYHPSAHPKTEPLGEAFFLSQADTILTNADGLVVFDATNFTPPINLEPIMQKIAAKNAAGGYE